MGEKGKKSLCPQAYGPGGGAAASPKFGQLGFIGQQEKFGQSEFLKKFVCVCVCMRVFFSKRDIEVSLVKPVKFTQWLPST